MPVATQSGVPSSFTQGDSVAFSYSDPNFPPSAWGLKLLLFSAGKPYGPFAATPDGAAFDFALTPAQTLALPPGNFTGELRATSTDASQSFPLGCRFTLFIYPGLGVPLSQTPAMKSLATLQAVSAGTIQSYSAGGVTWSKRNLAELRKEIDRLTVIVDAELRALGLSTRGGAKTLVARFC